MFNFSSSDSNKVFIVVNSFGRGGAEMSLALLALELSKMGYSVYYISLWDEIEKYDFDWLEQNGVSIITLTKSQRNIFHYYYKFIGLVLRHNPVFIYSAMLKADFLSRIVSIFLNVKSASSIRNNPIKYYHKSKIKLLIFLMIQRFQKNIIFLSDKSKRDFLEYTKYNPLKAKIFVLHNPIALDYSLPENFQFTKLDTLSKNCFKYKRGEPIKFYLGIVSRLVPGKGILELLRTIRKELLESNFRLEIFGDGPLRGDIQNFISDNQLQNKVFLNGFVKNKFEIYSKIDILFFPSENEGFGRVPFEAILMGNVVACNKKVSIINEFFNIPLLWNEYDNSVSISGILIKLADLDVKDSINQLYRLSMLLSPREHCRKFIQIMNECV